MELFAEYGPDGFHVVEMEFDGYAEQMVNIRTLTDFLKEKAPDSPKYYHELAEEN